MALPAEGPVSAALGQLVSLLEQQLSQLAFTSVVLFRRWTPALLDPFSGRAWGLADELGSVQVACARILMDALNGYEGPQ